MKYRHLSSIRTRLAWLVAACLLPAFLIAGALVYAYYANEQEKIVRDSSASVLALTYAVDRELVSVETALMALASSPNLPEHDLAAFDAQARTIVEGKRVASVVLASLSGQQLINTRRPWGEPLPTVGDPGLIARVLETRETVVSDLYVGQVLRQPLVSIAVPVFSSDEIIYVLIASILPERFEEILLQQRVVAGAVSLLDRNANVVAQNPALKMPVISAAPPVLQDALRTGNQGQIANAELEGGAALLVFNRSPYSGWSVVKSVPRANLIGDLWRTVGWLMATLMVLLGASLLLAWVMGGRISRPLARLSMAARELDAGLPTDLDLSENSYREVQILSDSLTSLLRNLLYNEAELTELNRTLERRVAQRTHQVSQALETLRQSEERVKSIVDTAQAALIGVDFNGRITDWNMQAEAMLGWARDDILGQPLTTLVPERFKNSIERSLSQFASTGSAAFTDTRFERLLLTKGGLELPTSVRIGLINRGKLKFFTAFVFDISDMKKMERLKSEFISTASHELRTPLTSIYASLDMLHSGMAGELPPDAAELLGIAHKSAERLVRLVNDVLDVEKIESSSMDYRKAQQPLWPLLEQAIAATQGYADQFAVKFVLSAQPAAAPAGESADELGVKPATQTEPQQAQVDVDADRIIQVVVNLLSNAAKFSPPGGAVVTVQMRPGASAVRVSVVDTGVGIIGTFRDRIFERFAQADSSDRRQKGGTGLGLNICKSIVEAHNGQIGFISEPGAGSEFYFDLPLAAAS